jgi:predicted nuclease of restriction endonuclease-like (RecB) superfamily
MIEVIGYMFIGVFVALLVLFLKARVETSHERTWVELTNEEILKHQDIVENSYSLDLIEFARAIEAKLKEKNNGTV